MRKPPVTAEKKNGIRNSERIMKRSFDLIVAVIGLLITGWIIAIAYLTACLDTGSSGFFSQIRVGRNGRLFRMFKIKTMKESHAITTTVTTKNDPRITALGRFFRKTKIDELPQLINVLVGQMSFVGPRPDVPGFADNLTGEDKIILTVRPGITGPATLKYRNEEELLATQKDPDKYNRDIIFPDKVRLNREYVENYSFSSDIKYIMRTIFSS